MKRLICKVPGWILLILILSMLITFWDALFVLMRPESLPGGKLAFIWLPYAKYITIDTAYGDINNHFVVAQALMTLFEIVIGVFAVGFYLASKHRLATLLAFSSFLLTGTKTVLIFVLEAVSHFVHVAHNSWHDLIFLYVIPNGIWIVIPYLCVLRLGYLLICATMSPNRTDLPIF